MGQEINLLDTYPKAVRDYDKRQRERTPEVIRIAKQFGKEFFDGERRYGTAVINTMAAGKLW